MGSQTVNMISLWIIALMLRGNVDDMSGHNDKVMERIEQRIHMPKGAHPLGSYARFYVRDPTGIVRAIFVVPPPELNEGDECEEVDSNDEWHAIPCPVSERAYPEVKAGERRWIIDHQTLPSVMDGGCAVLEFAVDTRTVGPVYPLCHGEA